MSVIYGAASSPASTYEGSPHHHHSNSRSHSRHTDTHTMSDPLVNITSSDTDVNPDLVASVDGDAHIKSYQSDNTTGEGETDYDICDSPSEPRVCYCCTRKQRRWACLIGSVFTLTMIILFCVGYWVIIPYIAQKQVDGATVTFGRLGLFEPNHNSFSINVTGALHSDVPFDASTDVTEMNIYYSYPDPSYNTTLLSDSNTNTTIPIPMIETLIGSAAFPSLTLTSGMDVVPIDTTTTFYIKDELGFQKFMLALVNSSSCTWRLRADLTIHAHLTSVITITIPGIHLDKEVVIPGLNGLVDANMTILDVDVVGGDPDSVWLLPTLSINDTSNISMDMAPDGVTLSMIYNYNGIEVEVGNATVPDFHLYPGITLMSTVTHIYQHPLYPELIPSLLSDFIAGRSLSVLVTGAPNGVPKLPLMSSVLQELRLPAQLPGFQKTIVQHAHAQAGAFGCNCMMVSLNVSNYWNVSLDIQACDIDVWYTGVKVGKANIPTFNHAAVIGPYNSTDTPYVKVDVLTSDLGLVLKMLDALQHGGAYLDINGTMTMGLTPPGVDPTSLSSTPFVTTVQYAQQNVLSTWVG